jgi:hypothetical protein
MNQQAAINNSIYTGTCKCSTAVVRDHQVISWLKLVEPVKPTVPHTMLSSQSTDKHSMSSAAPIGRALINDKPTATPLLWTSSSSSSSSSNYKIALDL